MHFSDSCVKHYIAKSVHVATGKQETVKEAQAGFHPVGGGGGGDRGEASPPKNLTLIKLSIIISQ